MSSSMHYQVHNNTTLFIYCSDVRRMQKHYEIAPSLANELANEDSWWVDVGHGPHGPHGSVMCPVTKERA